MSIVPTNLHQQPNLTIMTSPSTITHIQLASPESTTSQQASSSRHIIASVPMRRSPASIGTPYNPLAQPQPFAAPAPASLAMSRSPANNNSNAAGLRRIPAPVSMSRNAPYGGAAMGRQLPYGGVAMERSKSSMGTDFNPFYCRQAAAPRTPPRRGQVTLACPTTPTLLPSPPASPTTPTPMSAARGRLTAVNTNIVCDENNTCAKRSALTPRAFPVAGHAGFTESPRSVRPRRRRGLSAPPPLHLRSSSSRASLLAAVDGTKSLRLAARISSAPIRALPFHQHSEPIPVVVASRE